MKVYSDKLTSADLYRAGPHTVTVDELDAIRRPRVRRQGWEVKLTGSSPYNGQGRSVKAATYDEHGWWMMDLFAIDPDAVIASYRGVGDFHRQTNGKFQGVAA